MSCAIITRPSFSSRLLGKRLRIKRVKVGERRTPRVSLLINWGCSEIPGIHLGTAVINDPRAVRTAVDKIATFKTLKASGIPTVDFTENLDEAQKWLDSGTTVYGRALTRASGGAGIHLYIAGETGKTKLPKFPLFTKFWKCDRELRVHVFRGEVIDFSEKRRIKTTVPPKNRYWIRTHGNGWIFARSEAQLHDKVKSVCIQAVRALGLDFGAVDVRARKSGECRVLEVNSAPGITGTTLNNYHRAFWRIIHAN